MPELRYKIIYYTLLQAGMAAVIFAMALILRAFIPAQNIEIPAPVINIINDAGQIEQTGLESFLIGVLAAEMPASFHIEALKAQAIAARTYIVNNMLSGGKHDGAIVCCSSKHCQAYSSDTELQTEWANDYAANLAKISLAVKETEGMVLTHKGTIIDALYFSTCGGHTASAAAYWGNEIPYLQQVECGYCLLSPRYRNTQSFSLNSAAQSLACSASDISRELKSSSARSIREELGLYSARFSWSIDNDKLTVRSSGSGHGVGLCQYGADGMAKSGYDAAEILNHYYTNIDIINAYTQANHLSK